MIFVDVADAIAAIGIDYMQSKNTFRAAEVGEGFLLAVLVNVLTSACPKLGDGVAAISILLGNTLAVVAVSDLKLLVALADANGFII